MPFGKYKDFAECIRDQMKNHKYSKEQAGGVCGLIEKRHKQKHKLSDDVDSVLELLDELERC